MDLMNENNNVSSADSQSSTSTQPIGFTKSKKFLFFKIKSKPIYENNKAPTQVKPQKKETDKTQDKKIKPNKSKDVAKPSAQKYVDNSKYINRMLMNRKGLESALRDIGIKNSPYSFIKKMVVSSIIIAIVVSILIAAILYKVGVSNVFAILIISLVSLIAVYNTALNNFVNYPITRGRKLGKEIDKDILFATRDMIISMRSGMPLFNAMTSISTGYGWASHEFSKIVSLVQLGMPVEQAIDEITDKSYSKTFKRIMLQASISIKVGADVTASLQGVVNDIMQERVIELRRYGQRLNALAMFYMIFGVIFPSMGIAVAAIMTTFISLVTIDTTTLVMVLVFIVGIQIVFLNLIKSSRPSFTM